MIVYFNCMLFCKLPQGRLSLEFLSYAQTALTYNGHCHKLLEDIGDDSTCDKCRLNFTFAKDIWRLGPLGAEHLRKSERLFLSSTFNERHKF